MKTRNQIKQEEQTMIAEFTQKFFEESSKAWLANKEKYGENMYRYKSDAFHNENENEIGPRRSKRLLERKTKS